MSVDGSDRVGKDMVDAPRTPAETGDNAEEGIEFDRETNGGVGSADRDGDEPTVDPGLVSLIEGIEGASIEDSVGQTVIRLPKDSLRTVAEAAREAGFEVCADITAVDWFRERRVRYDVVVSLLSVSRNQRVRIIAGVPRDDLTVPSLVPVYPGANFPEREVYDMFGIIFEDHPDLTRILMPDDWTGYPLRKDFDVGGVPVQFKGSHEVI